MTDKELKATSINKSGNLDPSSEVDALIQETLAETKKDQKVKEETKKPAPAKEVEQKPVTEPENKEKKEESFKATTLSAPPGPKQAAKEPQENAYEKTFKEYKVGDTVQGTVVKIDPSGVLVDINYKAEGLITMDELTSKKFSSPEEIVKIGDKINVSILNLENKEGYIVLSSRQTEYETTWKTAQDAYRNKRVLEAKVTSAVKGGLVVDWQGIRGFIPASQVAKETHENLDSFVGKKLSIKIIQLDRSRNRIVLSHKLGSKEKDHFKSDKLFQELEVGQVRKGKVSSLKPFGAFVDLGGAEGLIHITELSWKRVKHPSEVVKSGQEIDVFILGVDKTNRKISLGLKELQDDPWVDAAEKYKPGQTIPVKIARFTKFGAFVDLDNQLEGLVHVSEISKKPFTSMSEVLKIGQTVDAKILRVQAEEQRIGLSIKQVEIDKEKKKTKEYQDQTPSATLGDMVKAKEEAKDEPVE